LTYEYQQIIEISITKNFRHRPEEPVSIKLIQSDQQLLLVKGKHLFDFINQIFGTDSETAKTPVTKPHRTPNKHQITNATKQNSNFITNKQTDKFASPNSHNLYRAR
jgi:hypothetical protein